ncbi:hypothetical protein EV126DRAFT_412761 [Verticillium dahliae]|nr:hypothetical protein EV126DRAFT_412761 [Verticillium dahliae]
MTSTMDIAQILRNLESRFETSAPEGDVSGLLHANNFIPHLPLWTRDPECFFTGPVPSGVSHLRLNAIRRRILVWVTSNFRESWGRKNLTAMVSHLAGRTQTLSLWEARVREGKTYNFLARLLGQGVLFLLPNNAPTKYKRLVCDEDHPKLRAFLDDLLRTDIKEHTLQFAEVVGILSNYALRRALDAATRNSLNPVSFEPHQRKQRSNKKARHRFSSNLGNMSALIGTVSQSPLIEIPSERGGRHESPKGTNADTSWQDVTSQGGLYSRVESRVSLTPDYSSQDSVSSGEHTTERTRVAEIEAWSSAHVDHNRLALEDCFLETADPNAMLLPEQPGNRDNEAAETLLALTSKASCQPLTSSSDGWYEMADCYDLLEPSPQLPGCFSFQSTQAHT